jgi:2,5-furandicarboxylate decarboxylase 1
VPSAQAPVHEVVLTGDDADLTTLPVHLQHGLDGAPYISASIDYARDGKSGFTNIGCRRLMLRGPRAAGIDLNALSDLRALYRAAVARGERMPVAFAVGSHPTDFLAAVAATAPMDELDVVGARRAGAGGEMRHRRCPRSGRRRTGARRLYRRARADRTRGTLR